MNRKELLRHLTLDGVECVRGQEDRHWLEAPHRKLAPQHQWFSVETFKEPVYSV